jgi:hypothetical protein
MIRRRIMSIRARCRVWMPRRGRAETEQDAGSARERVWDMTRLDVEI